MERQTWELSQMMAKPKIKFRKSKISREIHKGEGVVCKISSKTGYNILLMLCGGISSITLLDAEN